MNEYIYLELTVVEKIIVENRIFEAEYGKIECRKNC